MKIAIIGYSGAGKSTLAKRLAQELGIEPLYLDRVHFLQDWTEREEESGA
jgi:adenylate kinase family enzyme